MKSKIIVYKRDYSFGKFLQLFTWQDKLSFAQVRKKIVKASYYRYVLVELEKLNDIARELIGNKVIDMRYDNDMKKIVFARHESVEITSNEDHFFIRFGGQDEDRPN